MSTKAILLTTCVAGIVFSGVQIMLNNRRTRKVISELNATSIEAIESIMANNPNHEGIQAACNNAINNIRAREL